MESLVCKLSTHIAEHLPQLSLVDEDYGQVESLDTEDKDMYPLTFPCVLIDAPSTEWSNVSDLEQKGESTLRIKLIIDCYDDTHHQSTTTAAIQEREQLRHALHSLLQGYRADEQGALIRTSSRFYTANHGIKVYEQTYTCAVSESVKIKTVQKKEKISFCVSV